MSRILVSAGTYIQGADSLQEIGIHTAKLGNNAFVIGGQTALSLVGSTIRDSLAQHNINYTAEPFKGISSQNEIARLKELAQANKADTIIATGGGAAQDTGKAVAHQMDVPVIVVPTTAATDAPCAALCVIYTEEGTFSRYLHLRRNPECVLMDTNIIANAPVRFLIAGMGDAIATLWESQSCEIGGVVNTFSGATTPTLTVHAISQLCYATLLQYGAQAIQAVKQKTVNSALEAVVEANTLMSGIASENGGHAAAHSIHNGLTALEETKNTLHGEKVAFGLLAQLIMEKHPVEKFEEVQSFCFSVGLPICLQDLGIAKPTTQDVKIIAQRSVVSGESIHATQFEVTSKIVEEAIWIADELGQQFKEKTQQIK